MIENLKRVIAAAQKADYIFVASADESGSPHIAAAGNIDLTSEGFVTVTSWFCPATLANLAANKRISVVVWDFISNLGFQLLGEVKEVQEVGVLNGYHPKTESNVPLPQVERQLLVKVKKIMEFTHLPHTDKEIER